MKNILANQELILPKQFFGVCSNSAFSLLPYEGGHPNKQGGGRLSCDRREIWRRLLIARILLLGKILSGLEGWHFMHTSSSVVQLHIHSETHKKHVCN